MRTLYLDRNLGKHQVANALRDAGYAVEIHDDHLPMDAPDEDWISLVGRKGWIALTKDKNIRYRYAELAAVKEHHARVIVIRAKNLTGAEMAVLVVRYNLKIQKYAADNSPPFVAGLDRRGKLSRYDLDG